MAGRSAVFVVQYFCHGGDDAMCKLGGHGWLPCLTLQ